MTTSDEWVRERARLISWGVAEEQERLEIEQAIAAFGQEAIERTRAEERALAAAALPRETAAAYRAGYRACLARLENPDEAMVEALKSAGFVGPDGIDGAYLEGSLNEVCRALAITLAGQEGENTDG